VIGGGLFDMGSAISALNEFLHASRTRRLRLVLLRPKSLQAASIFAGDIDFLCDPTCLDEILIQLHACCCRNERSFTVHRRKLEKTQVLIFDEHPGQRVCLDLWTELDVKGPGVTRRDSIPYDALEPEIEEDDGAFSLPPVLGALLYLGHLCTKKREFREPEVEQRLSWFHERIPDAESRWKEVLAGIHDQSSLHAAATEALSELKASGRIRRSFRHYLRKQVYRVSRRRTARRKFWAIVGPDGSGKTTIIDLAFQMSGGRIRHYRFKRLFRRSWIYQLALPHLRRKAEERHGAPLEKNQVDDRFHLFLFRVSLLRAPLMTGPRLSGHIRAVDRYYPDLLLTGGRFQDRPLQPDPHWQRRLALVPVPRLYLQLDAPTATIRRRKSELSDADIDAYREWYFRMMLSTRTSLLVVLSTGNPLQACRGVLETVYRM
jgi:hypothetical protein